VQTIPGRLGNPPYLTYPSIVSLHNSPPPYPFPLIYAGTLLWDKGLVSYTLELHLSDLNENVIAVRHERISMGVWFQSSRGVQELGRGHRTIAPISGPALSAHLMDVVGPASASLRSDTEQDSVTVQAGEAGGGRTPAGCGSGFTRRQPVLHGQPEGAAPLLSGQPTNHPRLDPDPDPPLVPSPASFPPLLPLT